MTSIEQDILDWAKTRPVWQRSLLKRIARGEVVGDDDIASIAQAIVEKRVTLELPELALADLPAGTAGGDTVQLVSVGNLKHVNALLEGQTLTFGGVGLTVVYGDNGSGKSGYARLAKEVVGARHQESILSDAFASSAGGQSAEIAYTLNGTQTAGVWPNMEESALNQAHFYDEACGDDYLDRDTELAYRPSVLSLLDTLIVHVDAVRRVFDALIKENEARALVRPQLPAGSFAESFLDSISAKTTKATLDEALAVPADAKILHADLVKEEARLKTSDPAKEKMRLAQAAGHVHALADSLGVIEALLSPARAEELLILQAEASSLRVAAHEVSRTSFSEEPLAGVGSDAWRALWQAAENYSVAHAYPDEIFPATRDEQVCVLCQQPLQAAGQDRLRRFHQFVHNDVATRAHAAETNFRTSIEDLNAIELDSIECQAAIDFLAAKDKTLADSLTDALETAKIARTRIGERLRGETSEPWIPLEGVDIEDLCMRGVDIATNASLVDDTAFAKTLTDCQNRLRELEGQIRISAARDDIDKEIARMVALADLRKIMAKITTQGITTKSNDLARTYVTDVVKDQFMRESERLKLKHVILGDKGGNKGKLLHKPALLGATTSSPRQVLSEGEQTAAGLAGFFTEIQFDATKSAVILDDPISSLDHDRRGSAAKRIVEFSVDRQVVVFTHDLVFLGELVREAGENKVKLTERAIERNGVAEPGVIANGLPWKAKDADARIGELKAELDRLRKAQATMSADEYSEAAQKWGGRLSQTWERLVRSEVVNKVVVTGEVRPRMFKVIANITKDDDSDFQAGYAASSRWAPRHDPSEEVNFTPPTPDDLEAEYDRIKEWRERLKKYGA